MKPKIAKLVSGLLLKYTETPPDIVMQECLAGNLPECNECSNTLVTSKTLLMYHIGFNTSTSEDRAYKKHDFQCGWRHPFVSDIILEWAFRMTHVFIYNHCAIEWGSQRHNPLINVQNHVILFERLFFYHPPSPPQTTALHFKQPPKSPFQHIAYSPQIDFLIPYPSHGSSFHSFLYNTLHHHIV